MIDVQNKVSVSGAHVLGPIKFILFIFLLVIFIIHHLFISFLTRDLKKRTHLITAGIAFYSKMASFLLKIKVISNKSMEHIHGSMIVSNHLSYVDVLVLSLKYPSLFVTSVEVKETFFLGQVSKMAGCFFVERRRSRIVPGTKEKELMQMKEMIKLGFNVLLFPEGTSSEGHHVLPFKATFFQLPIDLDIPVIPITLKYKGEARKMIPWFGPMTFADHLLKVCCLREIEVEICELPKLVGKDKFELAQKSFRAISECYEKN